MCPFIRMWFVSIEMVVKSVSVSFNPMRKLISNASFCHPSIYNCYMTIYPIKYLVHLIWLFINIPSWNILFCHKYIGFVENNVNNKPKAQATKNCIQQLPVFIIWAYSCRSRVSKASNTLDRYLDRYLFQN